MCDVSHGIRTKQYEGVSCLAAAGFDFGTDFGKLFFDAAYWDSAMLQIVLRGKVQVNVDMKDKSGSTAFLSLNSILPGSLIDRPRSFSWQNIYRSKELLLQRGANPNSVSTNGESSLMLQAQYGLPDHVELLLRYGANPNLQAYDGKTALMLSSDNVDKINFLLTAKTNIYLKDANGDSAIFYAIKGCQTYKLEALIKEDPAVLSLVNNQGLSAKELLNKKSTGAPCDLSRFR